MNTPDIQKLVSRYGHVFLMQAGDVPTPAQLRALVRMHELCRKDSVRSDGTTVRPANIPDEYWLADGEMIP